MLHFLPPFFCPISYFLPPQIFLALPFFSFPIFQNLLLFRLIILIPVQYAQNQLSCFKTILFSISSRFSCFLMLSFLLPLYSVFSDSLFDLGNYWIPVVLYTKCDMIWSCRIRFLTLPINIEQPFSFSKM